jgi:hypothetical protein
MLWLYNQRTLKIRNLCMKYISFILIPFLTSCGVNMDLLHGFAKVTNDNAITIEVQREAMGPEAKIQIGLDIGNCANTPPKPLP